MAEEREARACVFIEERKRHLNLTCDMPESSTMHEPHPPEDQAQGAKPFCMTGACHPYTPPESIGEV